MINGKIPELHIIHKNVLCGPTPAPHGTILSADKCPKPNNKFSLIDSQVETQKTIRLSNINCSE